MFLSKNQLYKDNFMCIFGEELLNYEKWFFFLAKSQIF